MANPTLLSRLLCADADKNTIPDTDAGTAGVFSQQYGWQAINSLPLSAGGKAVQRQDFNGVFNLLGGIAFYAQKGYTFEWDMTQDYYANCVVTDPLDGNKYNAKNDVAKGGSNPSLDSTNWELFGVVDLSGKANVTLNNLDTANLTCHLVVDSYYNSSTGDWYRVYDDGWVEQGGLASGDGANISVTLLKPMADGKYCVTLTTTMSSAYTGGGGTTGVNTVNSISGGINRRTTTGFYVNRVATESVSDGYGPKVWCVIGMGANV